MSMGAHEFMDPSSLHSIPFVIRVCILSADLKTLSVPVMVSSTSTTQLQKLAR